MTDADVVEEVERMRPMMELYDRVCGELDQEKPWSEIDHGLPNATAPVTQEFWSEYMQTMLISGMRTIIHAAALARGSKRPLR